MFVLAEHEQIKLQTDARYEGHPGVLTITNQRVAFTRPRGRLSRKSLTAFSVPLTSVKSAVEEPGGVDTTVVLTVGAAEARSPPRVELHVSNAVHLARAIESLARAARETAARVPSPLTPPVHVTVNVPPVPPGPPVILVRCSYCRTVYPELDAKCPSCGAPF